MVETKVPVTMSALCQRIKTSWRMSNKSSRKRAANTCKLSAGRTTSWTSTAMSSWLCTLILRCSGGSWAVSMAMSKCKRAMMRCQDRLRKRGKDGVGSSNGSSSPRAPVLQRTAFSTSRMMEFFTEKSCACSSGWIVGTGRLPS